MLVLEKQKWPFVPRLKQPQKESKLLCWCPLLFWQCSIIARSPSALPDMPVKIDYVSRFKTDKEIKEIIKEVKEGEINIIIGTHRVVSKDVEFKNLGLLVIDEEQKFGVKVKDRLKELKVNVDVLTLTATPIPRTLAFFINGCARFKYY
jgi:RecG-like helicase